MRMRDIPFHGRLLIVGLGLLTCAASGQAQAVPAPTVTVMLTSAPPYTATGELFILKADTNTVDLRNPVLVVEGFDIGNSMNWPELYGLLNQENLVEDLQSFGRDLLVLNFTDSTVDIFENAALNETAIDYINAHRADSSDKFTAVGASLGGLTLRKALVDMPNHDVDTWISFDAPHEGANIPLGLQEFFEHFSTVNLADFDAIREFLSSLDSPAARQLLIAHHSHSPDAPAGGSTPERQDFLNTLGAAGYPTNCKMIAISNGSGFGGKLPFEPGDLIIHWYNDGPILIGPDINADIYALPQSTNTATTVYYGRFTSLLGSASPSSKTVASRHPFALDNAPGGMRASFYELFTNLPSSYIDGDDYCSQTNHCFVPTVSALGIPLDHLESNLAANASLTALSPFDEIHYAVDNEAHVEINAHNKRWIMRAMLENHDSDSDGIDDYGEFLIGTDYNSTSSTLQVVQNIVQTNGNIRVSWNTYPNTRYEVWFTPDLTNTWSLVETIPPTTNVTLVREYAPDPSGFFEISAYLVDPVTD